jgi:hypothetical protein
MKNCTPVFLGLLVLGLGGCLGTAAARRLESYSVQSKFIQHIQRVVVLAGFGGLRLLLCASCVAWAARLLPICSFQSVYLLFEGACE